MYYVQLFVFSPLSRYAHNIENVGVAWGEANFQLYQERIIEKKGRGRERETTTHLIKIQIFTHASRVTKFSCTYDAPRVGVV